MTEGEPSWLRISFQASETTGKACWAEGIDLSPWELVLCKRMVPPARREMRIRLDGVWRWMSNEVASRGVRRRTSAYGYRGEEEALRYIGIDIAKKMHAVAILDERGEVKAGPFTINNTASGFQKLLERFEKTGASSDECLIGMEATGHYWIALFDFLARHGFDVAVINPIQTDAFRKVDTIRKTKTDDIDAVLIANLLRFKAFEPSKLAQESTEALKQLTRFRMCLIKESTQLKNQATAILDRVFPEYHTLFHDIFGEASKELLKRCATPEEILSTDIRTLTRILSKSSRGKLGRAKADAVKETAKESIGVSFASNALSFELKQIVGRLSFTRNQIDELDKEIGRILEDTSGKWLTTIPGIGANLAAQIAGEIGDPNRFEDAKKLIAYAGIDASKKESGTSIDSPGHMSKRGSSQLRYALILAADKARLFDSYFGEYYDGLRARGKHHYVALSGVARKLAGCILALMKEERAYQPQPPRMQQA